jgi:hypothetical protein
MSYTSWVLKSLIIKSIFFSGVIMGSYGHAMQPGSSLWVYQIMNMYHGDRSQWAEEGKQKFDCMVTILEGRSRLSVEQQLSLLDTHYPYIDLPSDRRSTGDISLAQNDVRETLSRIISARKKKLKEALLRVPDASMSRSTLQPPAAHAQTPQSSVSAMASSSSAGDMQNAAQPRGRGEEKRQRGALGRYVKKMVDNNA